MFTFTSLDITIKPKAKYIFRTAAILLLYILRRRYFNKTCVPFYDLFTKYIFRTQSCVAFVGLCRKLTAAAVGFRLLA
jgi:hypothetical protein